jgi:hypothetical protein
MSADVLQRCLAYVRMWDFLRHPVVSLFMLLLHSRLNKPPRIFSVTSLITIGKS